MMKDSHVNVCCPPKLQAAGSATEQRIMEHALKMEHVRNNMRASLDYPKALAALLNLQVEWSGLHLYIGTNDGSPGKIWRFAYAGQHLSEAQWSAIFKEIKLSQLGEQTAPTSERNIIEQIMPKQLSDP